MVSTGQSALWQLLVSLRLDLQACVCVWMVRIVHNTHIYAACNALRSVRCAGYGDITPKEHKFIWAIYFLFSVIVFSYVIGECVGIVLEYSRWRRLMRTFEGGLTEELLHRMDITHDNQVRFALEVTCKLVARVVGQCA